MTELTTNHDKLLRWNGRIVPWVTRWTGEVVLEPIGLHALERDGEVAVMVEYKDGNELREPSGVMWLREGMTRGGEPEFSQVNAHRQRVCMTRCRCQVCGLRIDSDVITWLLDAAQVEVVDGETITISPPTCDDCVPIALDMCPHLKGPNGRPVIAKVLEYEVWGVWGEVVSFDMDTMKTSSRRELVPYRGELDFPRFSVLARQQAVRFNKFVIDNGDLH